jgi:beta-N-acetylhexosaminidase
MTSQVIITFAIVSCCCLAHARSKEDKSEPVTLTKEGQKWVEETLKSLSLEEKVGQMLQVRAYIDSVDFNGAEYKHIRGELREYRIGSVVLGTHFKGGSPVHPLPENAAKVTNHLQSDSKLPLLIAADIERGLASRLGDVPDFPWPMALGAVGETVMAERFGAITARGSRAVGINWALAPVADVNSR